MTWLWVLGIVTIVIAGALLACFMLCRRVASNSNGARFDRARRAFQSSRAELQTAFFRRAAASGKPRGLRWKNCDFDEQVTFAKDRKSGDLLALVGVTISFEAIEGGDMEDVAAVGNLRAGTALFAYTPQGWQPTARPLFNLEPEDALARPEWNLEMVSAEHSEA